MNIFRKKETVHIYSGRIFYKIQIKRFIFWFDFKVFKDRISRDTYFNNYC